MLETKIILHGTRFTRLVHLRDPKRNRGSRRILPRRRGYSRLVELSGIRYAFSLPTVLITESVLRDASHAWLSSESDSKDFIIQRASMGFTTWNWNNRNPYRTFDATPSHPVLRMIPSLF